MGRRSGLGKGLGALIPESPTEPASGAEGELRDLPISAIRPNRYQPRGTFEDEALAQLAASIEVLGVLQPVLVRRIEAESGDVGGDTYELIAGERRWRAAQLAGLGEIPALVRDVEHQQSLEQALVENLHREDLNPVEEAAAYRQLIDDFGLSHDEVARRVGKSRSGVSNSLRLLQLPPEVLEMLISRQLGAGHGRALLSLEEPGDQLELAVRARDEQWSVRRVEDEVKRQQVTESGATAGDAPDRARPGVPDRPAALLELEDLLSSHLDTRVNVQLSGKKGRLVIEFGGIEDLERIYRTVVDGRESE